MAGASALAACTPEKKPAAPQEPYKPTEEYAPTPQPSTEIRPTTEPTPEPTEYIRGSPWEWDFRHEVDGPLSETEWNFTIGTEVADYNGEAQAYTNNPENIRVENGALIIQARHEATYGREITSARIDTRGKFDFQYGTLEVTAKLPRGVGTWPAGWLLASDPQYNPNDFGIAPNDPSEFAVNGEIDFLEAIGSIDNENIPATHSYKERKAGKVTYTPGKLNDAYGSFNTYGIIKTPGRIEFTINGEVYASREQVNDDPLLWPYEQNYYLILNLAMGGSWAGQEKDTFPPHGVDTSMSEEWKYIIQKISYKPL